MLILVVAADGSRSAVRLGTRRPRGREYRGASVLSYNIWEDVQIWVGVRVTL
jgi:hypothetical protein